MRIKITIIFLLFGLTFIPVDSSFAAFSAEVTNDKVIFSFPETATFSARLAADAAIASVVLEYGNEQKNCGEVIAKAFPQFTPAKNTNVEWIWDMRQSGSLPPGASLWWRWRYTDDTGREYLSETQTATWLDNTHKWQTITSDFLRLHWYDGDQAFAKDLLNAGQVGLEFNKSQSGLIPDSPIDIYIYGNQQDMKDAILFEPAWEGGATYLQYDIVIIGISPSNAVWGRGAMVHELTHVLVHHLTFSCLGRIPLWIDEGLAVYSQAEFDASATFKDYLDQAISQNGILSLHSISGDFSAIPEKSRLSYGESYSIIKFLIDTYKQEKMTSLLTTLRDGIVIDNALTKVYGFDMDGLEDVWRDSVGAVRRVVSAQPTAQPTPTFVPTFVPVSGAPLAVTPTPYAIPTSTINGGQPALRGSPPIWLTLSLLGFCCLLMLIFGVFTLGFFVRSQNIKARKNDQAN